MPKDHRLKTREHKIPIMPPLNFLLDCTQQGLGDYEMARLGEVADLRKQLHAVWDRLVEQNALAILARWFRDSDRESINAALAIEESPEAWAKRQIRDRQRSEDELLPLPSLLPGAAHLAAALRYQERNIADGKCCVCPQPLDPNSVRFCTVHLAAARNRARKKAGVKGEPGSNDYLYGEISESTHGRQPGTLAALAAAREQKKRAILAELGIKPEHAAVTLEAAEEALLKNMPDSRQGAKPAEELWLAAPANREAGNQGIARRWQDSTSR